MVKSHTPGPWITVPPEVMEDGSVYPPHIVGGARQLQICSFSKSDSDVMAESATDIRSRAANVMLISAAPDLLAACRWAEAALAPFSKEPAEHSGIAMLRAAIAKATGAA